MEKPILFNTEMVKAILEGKKSCTRRVVKPHRQANIENMWIDMSDWDSVVVYDDNYHIGEKGYIKIPYKVGDILYVRETWTTIDNFKNYADVEMDEDIKYLYKCDDNGKEHVFIDIGVKRWKPSIHMPKEAARIFLEVTNVRVERLQDMKHDDFINEGIRTYTKDNNVFKYAVSEEQFAWSDMPRVPWKAFAILWDRILKKEQLGLYGWDNNPWVWVIEFKKLESKKD
ncbi:hypothetical protein [Clostridium sp.]|uniref:hypothetical protein n=1 Tax=Clostridium sp. TaxID=1506 RepID=UPI0032166E43